MIKSLSDDALSRLSKNVNRHAELRIATLCSGTDVAVWQLRDIIQAVPARAQLTHTMVCEIDPQKRSFLMANHNPEVLYCDIGKLSRYKDDNCCGHDMLSNRTRTMPLCDLLVVGYSWFPKKRRLCAWSDEYTIMCSMH